MTQTFQTNITVARDADGTMGIFTAHTENERTEAMTPPGFAWAFYEANK